MVEVQEREERAKGSRSAAPRWAAGPRRPALDGEVHVWAVSLDRSGGELRRLRSHLSGEEEEKAGRYHKKLDTSRSIACRGLLRELLGRYLDHPPAELKFRYGTHGKPYLSGSHSGDVKFNVSHAGDLALLAVTRGAAIGVDVERISPVPHLKELVTRFFSEAEQRDILELPLQDRTTAFFRAWTRKEAVIKALGEGLSRPLDSFDVMLGPHEPARVVRLDDVRSPRPEDDRWILEHLSPAPGVVGALAHPAPRRTVRCWSFPTAEL